MPTANQTVDTMPLDDVLARLTPKMRRFVEEYVVDFDARDAAARLGIDSGHAHTWGLQQLDNPIAKRYMNILLEQQAESTKLMANRIIIELARIAFGDVTNFVQWENGTMVLKNSRDLRKAVTSTIQSVDVGYGGKVKLKAYDKMQALELLMKHLGMVNPRASESSDSALDGLVDVIRASRMAAQTEVVIDGETGAVEGFDGRTFVDDDASIDGAD